MSDLVFQLIDLSILINFSALLVAFYAGFASLTQLRSDVNKKNTIVDFSLGNVNIQDALVKSLRDNKIDDFELNNIIDTFYFEYSKHSNAENREELRSWLSHFHKIPAGERRILHDLMTSESKKAVNSPLMNM